MRKVAPLKDPDCPQKHPVSLQSSFVVLVSSCWELLLSRLAQHLWYSQWQWLLQLSQYSGYFCFLSFLSFLSVLSLLFLHLALEFAEKCWQDLRQEKWCALGAASALPQASQLLLPLFPLFPLFPQSQRSQSSVSENANFHSLKPELQASLAASCRVQTRKCKRCCSFWRKRAKKQKRTERARPKANRECKRSVNKQMITDGLCDLFLWKPWNQYQCVAECNNRCLNRELVGTGQNALSILWKFGHSSDVFRMFDAGKATMQSRFAGRSLALLTAACSTWSVAKPRTAEISRTQKNVEWCLNSMRNVQQQKAMTATCPVLSLLSFSLAS